MEDIVHLNYEEKGKDTEGKKKINNKFIFNYEKEKIMKA